MLELDRSFLGRRIKFSGRMKNYNLEQFRKDIIAGIIVGVIAIPLALAFSIASGVKPEYGIYTAAIAGIMIGIFGGSHVQIGGPTGAFVPILFSIVTIYGYNHLLIAGLLSGIILTIMGLTKMGTLIKFIPRPVTVGFTAGIAVTIFFGQIDTFLGLKGLVKHELLLQNAYEIIKHINTMNLYSVLIAVVCLLILIFSHRIIPSIPGPLIVIVVATLMSIYLFNGRIETIGTKFGGIPTTIPAIHLPQITINEIIKMLRPAFAIAMLGSIESLLSCVVADGMTGKKHNSNKELIGQGIANIVAPLFGGIPATGAIARTATNVRSGGSTPVAAIVHSMVVLALVLIFAPLVSHIPLASMAPILMVVAWNMAGFKEIRHIFKTTKSDISVLIITFLLTVFLNLTTAVEIGLLMAAVLFINNMSKTILIEKVLPDHKNGAKVSSEMVSSANDCPQVSIFTIDGALFFGAVQLFEQTLLESIHSKPKVLILRMGSVSMLDATAVVGLDSIVTNFQKHKGIVLISGIRQQAEIVMKNSGLYDKIGKDNFFERTGLAINYALAKIDRHKCLGCNQRAFYECNVLSTEANREIAVSK